MSGDSIACVSWDGRAPVPYAPSADIVIVSTGDALFLAENPSRPPREPAMDVTRELGWVALDPSQARTIGDRVACERLLDRGALLTAADLLGGASRALDLAVEYAKDRVQFDRPIGSFQAVKHRCADMLVDVEGMRSTVYWAAWCIGAGDPEAFDRRIDREDVVRGRLEARHGVLVAGARRHRVHVGARPALLLEARATRPGDVRRRVVPPCASDVVAPPARRSGRKRR